MIIVNKVKLEATTPVEEDEIDFHSLLQHSESYFGDITLDDVINYNKTHKNENNKRRVL